MALLFFFFLMNGFSFEIYCISQTIKLARKQWVNIKPAQTWVDIVTFNQNNGLKETYPLKMTLRRETSTLMSLSTVLNLTVREPASRRCWKKHLSTNSWAGKHTCGFCEFSNKHSGDKKKKTFLFFHLFDLRHTSLQGEERRKKNKKLDKGRMEWAF